MERHEFDELDRQAWKELGFYYEFDDEKASWLIYGDRFGLEKFGRAVVTYTSSPQNSGASEHAHLGPYQYFKIVTSNEPKICEQGLFGSLKDLARFAQILNAKLKLAKTKDIFIIDDDYSTENTSKFLIHVMEEGFDPSTADRATWGDPV